eukprot:8358530-Pyramimonas_sp.AAC.1
MHEAAEPIYRQALEMTKLLDGKEAFPVAAVLEELGVCLCAAGAYLEAAKLLQEAHNITIKAKGARSLEAAESTR